MNSKTNEKVLGFILWTFGAIVLGILVCLLFLPLLGVNSWDALVTMFSGTFSDPYSAGNILVKAQPLILTGLAFAFTYKANLYNIGAQGQFYAGCICAVSVSLGLQNALPGWLVIILAMVAAIAGGGAVGFLIGFLKAKLHANEFLVSMMSSYVIIYIMQLLLRTVLQEKKHEYIKTDMLDKSVWLAKILPGTSVTFGILISLAAAILIWFILYHTTLGYRIRVTGLNMEAARMSGINPATQYIIAFIISGALAGLAGFVEVNGMQHMLLTGLDDSVGSYGIGIAILANANPISVIFAALLFGVLQVGGTALAHNTSAPASTIDLMLGFVMLFVLMSFYFRKKMETNRLKKHKITEEEA